MKKNIRQNSSLLKYIPFWLFECGLFLLTSFYILFPKDILNSTALIPSGMLLLVWALSAALSRFYAYERNLTFTKQLQRFIVFCAIFSSFVYALYIAFPQIISWNTQAILKVVVIVFLLKTVAILILFRLRKYAPMYQQSVLIYNAGSGKNFIRDIRQLKRTGFKVYEADKNLFQKDGLNQLKDTIRKHNIHTIYFPFEAALKKSNEHILNLTWKKQVKLKLVADYDFPITGKKAHFYGLTQVTKFYISPLDSIASRIIKRIFDVAFSGLVILTLLSWFIPLMAILIRLDSKGPTFFVQNRPGRFNKPFSCLKLRSMTVNNKTEKTAVRDDVRVTRIGKFIRKTSIDELPQFFNVLWGQMSIVGPRPNLSSQLDHYGSIIDDYPKRMYLKPGITGLAQISGARGGIEDDIEMKHRVKYDVFYIRNWSFALDIKIIIRTVINVVKGEDKAY